MLSIYTLDIARNFTLPEIQFSSVDLSQCSITQINQIPTKLLFISQLYLDNNLIKSLSGIEQFMNLQTLSLNFNYISQRKELTKINNKFIMRKLSFIGNPIQRQARSIQELREEGFSNLRMLNCVELIGQHIEQKDNSRCFVISNKYQRRQQQDAIVHNDTKNQRRHLNRQYDSNSNGHRNYSFNHSFQNQNAQQDSHIDHRRRQKNYHQNSNIYCIKHQSTAKNLNQSQYQRNYSVQSGQQVQGHNNPPLSDSSRFVYLTKRGQTPIVDTKREKQFQSTGDTRKHKVSIMASSPRQQLPIRHRAQYHYTHDSFQQSSPNFNQHYHQQQQQSLSSVYENSENDFQFKYRQSLPSRKVTEFNLYPVDEEMTRSRNIQNIMNQHYRINSYQNQQSDNYHEQEQHGNSFRKIKQLSKTINYNNYKGQVNKMKNKQMISPFYQTTQQPRYPLSEQVRYPPYKSQRYTIQQLNQNKEINRNIHKNYSPKSESDYLQNQSNSQNNQDKSEQGFKQIKREIPIYKQAIGVAFYYRNLLQKVFRGLESQSGRRLIRLNSQQSQKIQFKNKNTSEKSHNKSRQIDKFEQQDQQDGVKFVDNIEDSIEQYLPKYQQQFKNQQAQRQNHPQEQNGYKPYQILLNLYKSQQLQMLKYAWMKLQLYVNQQKIIQKYQQSALSKHHNKNQ